jgi:hypothetical protein
MADNQESRIAALEAKV